MAWQEKMAPEGEMYDRVKADEQLNTNQNASCQAQWVTTVSALSISQARVFDEHSNDCWWSMSISYSILHAANLDHLCETLTIEHQSENPLVSLWLLSHHSSKKKTIKKLNIWNSNSAVFQNKKDTTCYVHWFCRVEKQTVSKGMCLFCHLCIQRCRYQFLKVQRHYSDVHRDLRNVISFSILTEHNSVE